jgi:hypothetical protein
VIRDSAGVKRQAGWGGTAHAAQTVFCPFEKHYRKTGSTVQFILSNEAEYQHFLTKINYKRTHKM